MDRKRKAAYNLEQHIVDKHFKLKREAANNPKMVIGGRVLRFCFTRPNDRQERCAQGTVTLGKNSEVCKIFGYPNTPDCITKVINIAELSSKLRTPYILKTKIACLSYPKAQKDVLALEKELVLAYDQFDDFFDRWIESNPQTLFNEENGLLYPWWRRQLGNILATLEYIHQKKVFHGDLDDASKYVIVGNDIHLIDVGTDGSGKSDNELKFLTRKDLKGVKIFLESHTTLNHASSDWLDFIVSLDFVRVDVLEKHPLLMDGIERFKYFQDIIDDLNNREKTGNMSWQKFWSKVEIKAPHELKNWNSQIAQPSPFYDVYSYAVAKGYDTNSVADLLRYIRNVIKHIKKYVVHGGSYTRSMLEREISRMYPKLLLVLHKFCHTYNIISK